MTVKQDTLPDKQSPSSNDAALIAELAAKQLASLGETQIDVLDYPASAAEIFKLFGRSPAARETPLQAPLAAAATRGRISDLLLRQRAEESVFRTARHTNSQRKQGSGLRQTARFVPSEDDVANAVDGTTYRGECMLCIWACNAAVWAAVATWLFFQM